MHGPHHHALPTGKQRGPTDVALLVLRPPNPRNPRPQPTPLARASANLVNCEFVGCQFLVATPPADLPAVFINCVFRDTAGRPALVVAAGGAVVVKASLFVNNSAADPEAGPGAAAAGPYGGNGSAIYVAARGSIQVGAGGSGQHLPPCRVS